MKTLTTSFAKSHNQKWKLSRKKTESCKKSVSIFVILTDYFNYLYDYVNRPNIT